MKSATYRPTVVYQFRTKLQNREIVAEGTKKIVQGIIDGAFKDEWQSRELIVQELYHDSRANDYYVEGACIMNTPEKALMLKRTLDAGQRLATSTVTVDGQIVRASMSGLFGKIFGGR